MEELNLNKTDSLKYSDYLLKSRDSNQPLYNTIDKLGNIHKPLVLVGLGPHSKRIYMHYFKKYDIVPKLIIELYSKKAEVEEYLNAYQVKTVTYYIDDQLKDNNSLSVEAQSQLKEILKREKITHAIISTEPKAHFSYIRFFLENGIHTLTDKPITSPERVSLEPQMAKKIEYDFNLLVNLCESSKKNVTCQVQCQRRWHKGYQFIRDLMEEYILSYRIPITSIEVYHCDGMWNMPDEFLFRENHPYKYGYGKLFHSGYHFIDLACWLINLNNLLPSKRADNVELYSSVVRPDDFLEVISKENYQDLFHTNKFDDIFNNKKDYHLDEYGEIDYHGLLQFKRGDHPITTCTLNLVQNGYSRRSWPNLPEDT